MYRRITYLSTRVPGLSDEQLLDRLVLPARARNLESGVTSCLWTDGAWFFQLLEGSEAAVVTTLSRIVADPRHRAVRVVSSDRVDALVFQNEPLKLVLAASPQTGGVERTMRDLIDQLERADAGRKPLTRENVTVEALRSTGIAGAARTDTNDGGYATGVELKRVPLVVHVLTRLTCVQGV